MSSTIMSGNASKVSLRYIGLGRFSSPARAVNNSADSVQSLSYGKIALGLNALFY